MICSILPEITHCRRALASLGGLPAPLDP